MRLSLLGLGRPFAFLIGLVSFLIILASFATMVWTSYRVRQLHIEIERAHDVSRRLADDSSQLNLDLQRAAMPAAVSARARQLGFVTAGVNDTVIMEVSPRELDRRELELRP